MALKSDLLKIINENPQTVRDIFTDSAVVKKLSDIGILPKVLELHAPSPGSRKGEGLGPTLCGRNGTRHKIITCKQCLKKLQKSSRK